MVNVSLFPREPKGTELGEEIGKTGVSARPASGGVLSSWRSRAALSSGRWGWLCVTLGKSLSLWGLSFPEFAEGADGAIHHRKGQVGVVGPRADGAGRA